MSPIVRWALVDVETTGLHITHDKITEIAVIVITPCGIESTWHSLINPQRTIPEAVANLTGISTAMVANAPTFVEVAEELMGRLNDCVLVAHNVRFDNAFLKNAFKTVGISFQRPLLCTKKLFRLLHPEFKTYDLASLANRFALSTDNLHRAEQDVHLLYELLMKVMERFSWAVITEAARVSSKKASVPAQLRTDVNTLPNVPGVYIFYGTQKQLPLYIGKSRCLKQRVLSHFQADHAHAKEFALARQVERIEVFPTHGELSALLLESKLIKKKKPLYNRRLRRKKHLFGFKLAVSSGYFALEIEKECTQDQALYGAFSSVCSAKKALRSIVKEFNLCSKLCHLEKTGHACFSFQLKRCYGACIQQETPQSYNLRVEDALQQFKQASWPYPGAIAIYEKNALTQSHHYLVFDQWRHVTTIANLNEFQPGMFVELEQSKHCHDDYKILAAYLKKPHLPLTLLTS